MKSLILIGLLVLCACGGGGVGTLPISPDPAFPEQPPLLTWTGETVWEGWVSEDSELLDLYEETKECLGDLAITTELPYIVIITGEIYQPLAFPGLSWSAFTYLIEREIIINDRNPEGIYRHEFVHWLTWRDDSIHNEPFMAECTTFLPENTNH